jgi:putative acetyltransferase
MANLVQATAPSELAAVRDLFAEYAAGVAEPCCFAGFERELAGLPGEYAPPAGRLLLALERDGAAGCVGLRRVDAASAEIKRLYIRAAFRGHGLGRRLAQAAIDSARSAGYARVVLDTLPKMHQALALYRSMNFVETAPYLAQPTPGARCFELRF